jgi:hypothetical protein
MLDIEKARRMGIAFINRAKVQAAYRDVFDGEAGKRVLYDILRRAAVLSTPMVMGDPYETMRQIGRQDLAREILEILRWDPERLIALAEEREKLELEAEGV